MPDFLSIAQVAALSGHDRSWVKRHCASGRLPAIKVGRAWLVERADAERWSAEVRRPGRKARKVA